MASRSTAFTCLNNFVNTSTRNVANGLCLNVCCCCQCFGLLAAADARNVRPGESKVTKLTPKGVASAAHAASEMSVARFGGPTAEVIARA